VLAETVEDLAKKINSITTESLNSFRDNIVYAKEKLLPNNVKPQLEKIVES
jgi:hypothetical protein